MLGSFAKADKPKIVRIIVRRPGEEGGFSIEDTEDRIRWKAIAVGALISFVTTVFGGIAVWLVTG